MKVELVTSLKRQATKILADLHDTKEPVLITSMGSHPRISLMLMTTSLCKIV